MFIGHLAVGFVSKRVAPKASLGVLMAAPMALDLLWPLFLLAGWEQVRIDPGNTAFTPLDFVSYPYSHPLLMLGVWGALFAWVFRAPSRPRRALLLAALVVSHWVLDFVTHRPDMPLYPGGPKVGLGLWQSVPATVAIEAAMFAAGVWVYASCTRAHDRVGRWGFVGLTALFALAYVGNLTSPPPPSVNALIVVAIIGASVTMVLSWWVDRHREDTCLTP